MIEVEAVDILGRIFIKGKSPDFYDLEKIKSLFNNIQ